MNQDWIDRDRLLTQTHDAVMGTQIFVEKWTKEHDLKDDNRFKEINDRIKIGIWGIGACAVIVIANGGISAIKTIFNLH